MRPVGRGRIRQEREGHTAEGGATSTESWDARGRKGGKGAPLLRGARPPGRGRGGRHAPAITRSTTVRARISDGGEGSCKRKAKGRRERTKAGKQQSTGESNTGSEACEPAHQASRRPGRSKAAQTRMKTNRGP